MDNSIGRYRSLPFSKFRQLIVDGLELGREKHYVTGLIELDVTDSRRAIREYRRSTGRQLSLMAWVIKCIGQALNEHKALNAIRRNHNLIVFDDIDMAVAIEMETPSERVPRLHVIRKIHERSLTEIHDEIEAIRGRNKATGDIVLGEERIVRRVMMIMSLPGFIRRPIWRRLLRDPFYVKKAMGTVGITSVGMFGNLRGWAVPIPSSQHAVSFALGGITKKPGIVKDHVEIREYLSMSVFFDHDVVDGAPAARFTQRLRELIESGYGLKG